MDLLKKINEEADAGGASDCGSVSSVAMPLFSQFVRRSSPSNPAPKPILIKYGKSAIPKKKKKEPFSSLGLKEAVRPFYENLDTQVDGGNTSNPAFDSSEVTAKLKSLEQRDKEDFRDTTTFGLEDDDGKVIRVRVKNDQAQEFEKALQASMMDAEEDEALPEIAELLFKLKDSFDIVDVEWPEIEEDEEEGQILDANGMPVGGDDQGGDMDLMGDDASGDMDLMGDDAGGDMGAGAEPNVTDLLTQVIDMMKADAEARKADARAREAEAKNREAEAAISQASARVKHEEQLLDMDTYNKNKKEQEKESKRLAQLAQWKREVEADGAEDQDDFGLGQAVRGGAEENEEVRRPQVVKAQPGRKTLGGRVHPHDVAKFILNRMR